MSAAGEPIRLRRAGGPDLPRLVALERAAHAHPWSEAQLRREAEVPYSTVLCAELPGEGEGILGFVVYWVVHDELHVLDVVTAPEARRRGVARALMAEAMAEAGRRGARRALLEVRRSNAPAIALYRALGFVDDAVRRGYYQDGEDALLMSVALPG